MWSTAGMLLAPRACAACGQRVRRGAPLCAACLRELPRMDAPNRCDQCSAPLAGSARRCERCRRVTHAFDAHVSAYIYRDSGSSLLRAFKFGGRRSLAVVLATMLHLAIPADWHPDSIVPVPSRAASVRKRGFDAVAALSRRVGALAGVPVSGLLENVGSREQKGLGYEARFQEASARFRLRPGAHSPRVVLLIDDVFTTGATASACAKILKKGGAGQVFAMSVAIEL